MKCVNTGHMVILPPELSSSHSAGKIPPTHKHSAGSPHHFNLKIGVNFILSKVCDSAATSFPCRMK